MRVHHDDEHDNDDDNDDDDEHYDVSHDVGNNDFLLMLQVRYMTMALRFSVGRWSECCWCYLCDAAEDDGDDGDGNEDVEDDQMMKKMMMNMMNMTYKCEICYFSLVCVFLVCQSLTPSLCRAVTHAAQTVLRAADDYSRSYSCN